MTAPRRQQALCVRPGPRPPPPPSRPPAARRHHPGVRKTGGAHAGLSHHARHHPRRTGRHRGGARDAVGLSVAGRSTSPSWTRAEARSRGDGERPRGSGGASGVSRNGLSLGRHQTGAVTPEAQGGACHELGGVGRRRAVGRRWGGASRPPHHAGHPARRRTHHAWHACAGGARGRRGAALSGGAAMPVRDIARDVTL